MSLHKWKVFKGRFLGFENYQKIVGDIGSFWVFILGLLIMIFAYWFWSEFKNKFTNKFYCLLISLILLLLSILLINISWADMMEKGDEDFLNSLIYIFYYSFFAITTEVGLGLLIAFSLYQTSIIMVRANNVKIIVVIVAIVVVVVDILVVVDFLSNKSYF